MPGHGCAILAGFTAVYGSTVRGRWQISRGGNLVQSLARDRTDQSAKSREEHLLLIHEGPLRTTKNTFALSAKAREGARRTPGDKEFRGAVTRVRRQRGHPQGVPLRGIGGCVDGTQVGAWFGVLTSRSGWRGPSTQTSPSRQFSCFQIGTISLRRSMA